MKNNKRKVLGGIPAVFIVIILLAMVLRAPVDDNASGSSSDVNSVSTGNVDAGNVDAGDVDAGNVDTGNVDTVDVDTGNTAEDNSSYINYHFRKDKYLQEHYEKHGIDMGFASAEEYEKAASDVVNNPNALHKIEKEDNDDVYYVEETNEFVIVSGDGYLRTYFNPDSGKKYFDKQ